MSPENAYEVVFRFLTALGLFRQESEDSTGGRQTYLFVLL